MTQTLIPPTGNDTAPANTTGLATGTPPLGPITRDPAEVRARARDRYGIDVDTEAFGAEIDAIRDAAAADLGQADADYVRRVIATQRRLELAGRALLEVGFVPPLWFAGTGTLAIAKILENMEIGHNVMHGQWDWLGDDEIHSTNWEWDTVCTSQQWKHSHNVVHHTWTNVVGMDRDIGYGFLRMSEAQPWTPQALLNPIAFVLLAVLFQWGVGLHDLEIDRIMHGERSWRDVSDLARDFAAKARKQFVKDYIAFPALAGPFAPLVAFGNLNANLIRNLWAFTVIFCGHFPDGVQTFSADVVADETRGEWYLRQILGSCNFGGGKLLHLLTGNLSHQIEHHLFPDLPSNRYAEVAPKVREVCERHGVPYNTGSFMGQFATVIRRTLRLTFP